MKDIYLKFTGPDLKGESRDHGYEDWLEMSNWSHVIIQPKSATASTAGGHTSERADHQPMEFVDEFDVASPLIAQHCSGGTTFDEVEVHFMRADGEGKRVKYLEVKLKKVIISEVVHFADGGIPLESFALKYAAAQWKYTQQKIGGGQAGNVQTAWSLTKNDKTYMA
jgi:type VI secretion system secreted protein Hcp